MAEMIEALGPVTGSHIIVMRGVNPEAASALADAIIAAVQARGLEEGLAAVHVPLILCLDSPDQSLAVLSEEDMAREGWYRR